MRPTVWAEVKRVFADALDVPAARREDFVLEHCSDAAVREEALRLLRRRELMTRFLRPPLVIAGGDGAGGPESSESAGPGGRERTSTGVVDGLAGRGVADDRLAAGTVLAGRYELGLRLGAGAFGAVHRAADRLTGHDVAVKVLPLAGPGDQHAMRREVAVLRRARLPGVVELLDDGVELGHAFLVMRLVDGRAFPGAGADSPLSWDALASRAVAFVEALGRLHWLGVLHRDLKPDNVLVDSTGAVTIVDLGIARDVDGLPDAAHGYLVGTPAYLAPERLTATPASVASDLYSVGAMLWEALAGRPLCEARSFAELLDRRADPRPPLRTASPDVPEHVAAVVDAMLQTDPSARPRSARLAAALLRGDGGVGPGVRLPFVGSDAAVAAVVEAVRTRRPIAVCGPLGSGRTRTLEEAARRLAAEGRLVLWAGQGQAPFSALRTLQAGPPADGPLTLDAVRDLFARRIEQRLRCGAAVFADDWESLDPESRLALATAAHAGAVVSVLAAAPVDPPGSTPEGPVARVSPTPRTEDDLRALFHGPDRIFHLREDAARELHRRTGGAPGAVADQVHAWLERGVAHWEDGRCRIDREAIARLGARVPHSSAVPPGPDPGLGEDARLVQGILEVCAAPVELAALAAAAQITHWSAQCAADEVVRAGTALRAEGDRIFARISVDAAADWDRPRRAHVHGALADACPQATERRLHHLLAAELFLDAAGEAALLARRLVGDGRAAAALAVAHEGLGVCRGLDPASSASPREALLDALMDAALAAGTVTALGFAEYVVSTHAPAGSPLAQECLAARAALTGRWRDALELPAPGALDSGGSARRRLVIRCLAARLSSDRSLEREELVRAARWARGGAESRHETFLELRAWQHYRCDRFGRAARLHERVAARSRDARSRSTALLNAASAALEAFELDRARRLAGAASALAATRRDPHGEVRAEWILRSADYRSEKPLAPDIEFVELASAAGVGPNLEGLIRLTEAAIAWRAGMLRTASELAGSAAEVAGAGRRDSLELLARALRAACEPQEASRDAARAGALLAQPLEADTLLQARALLTLSDSSARVAGPYDASAGRTTKRRSEVRREVLSIDECRTLLEVHRRQAGRGG